MSECEKLLRAAGATMIRNGQKHRIYELGGRRCVVSHGTRESPFLVRQTRSLIRQYQKGGSHAE